MGSHIGKLESARENREACGQALGPRLSLYNYAFLLSASLSTYVFGDRSKQIRIIQSRVKAQICLDCKTAPSFARSPKSGVFERVLTCGREMGEWGKEGVPWPRDSFLAPFSHFATARQDSLKNPACRTSGEGRGCFAVQDLLGYVCTLSRNYRINLIEKLKNC